MKQDIFSNTTRSWPLAAISRAHNGGTGSDGIYAGTAIDMKDAQSVTFMIGAGTFGSSATLNAKLQWSANGTTGWTDENGASGNGTAITAMTEAGTAELHVIVPQARYYRVLATVGVAAVVCGVAAIAGPLRHVSPA
jgi:hypothetical protein